MNEITLRFDEPVTAPPGSITAWLGTTNAQPLNLAVSAGATPDELKVTLPAAVSNGIVTLIADYRITDQSANPLDGELGTPEGNTLFPSGDGRRGGQLVSRFRVLVGDANRDGVVDGNDLGLIISNFNLPFSQGDLDGDGLVDADDLNAVISNFTAVLVQDDGNRPQVVSTTPSQAQTLDAPTQQLLVRFNEPVEAARLTPSMAFLVNEAGTNLIVPTTVSLSNDRLEATFTLATPAQPCDTYLIGISPAISDPSGALLSPPSPAVTVTGLTPPASPTIDPTAAVTATEFFVFSGTAPRAASVEIVSPTPAGAVNVPVVNGAYSSPVQLPPDQISTISVTSISACGVRSAPASRRISRDASPPMVFIDYPPHGAQLTVDQVTVLGRVGDEFSGFAGLTVNVNGVQAQVNVGGGNNGTFVAPNVPINPSGQTTITATATDTLGNTINKSVAVTRLVPPANAFTMTPGPGGGGDGQSARVLTPVANPITVLVKKPDGSPLPGKLVTFDVVRSDGSLFADSTMTVRGTSSGLKLQVFTDSQGVASAFWRLGSDAGVGNNRVAVTSQDIVGSIFFNASATAAPAARIVVGDHNNQRGETGSQLPLPLRVFVTDGDTGNGAANVPVLFQVSEGTGTLDTESSTPRTARTNAIVVPTDATGHAEAYLTLGDQPGENLVEATFDGNPGLPATFQATGLRRTPGQPTTLEGLVLDNAGRAIGGALMTLKTTVRFSTGPTIFTLGPKPTDVDGRFVFTAADLPASSIDTELPAGPAKLLADARNPVTLNGQPLPVWSFPYVGYEMTIVPGAVNSLPTPIYLPQMDPDNEVLYDGTRDVVLKVKGIDGLEFKVKAGSLTRENLSRPSPADPEILRLNQVHFDEVPMPAPDGAAFPFAWTLQPKNARFDPPIEVTIPNLTALSPGSIVNISQWNNDTVTFQVMGTGKVSPDGSVIKSDPGTGITVAGWGWPLPPPPPTSTIQACFDLRGGSIAVELERWRQETEQLRQEALFWLREMDRRVQSSFLTLIDEQGQFSTLPPQLASTLQVFRLELRAFIQSPGPQLQQVLISRGAILGVGAAATAYLFAESIQESVLATGASAIAIGKSIQWTYNYAAREAICAAIEVAPLIANAAEDEALRTLRQLDALLPDARSAAVSQQIVAEMIGVAAGEVRGLLGPTALQGVNLQELERLADSLDELAADYDQNLSEFQSAHASLVPLFSNARVLREHERLRSFADLEGWSVSTQGRSAAVERIGRFRISGIPTRSWPVRVALRGTDLEGPIYARSAFIRLTADGVSSVTTPLTLATSAVSSAVGMSIESPVNVLQPTAGVQLRVLATQSDGSSRDVSSATEGTTYQTSSDAVASVSADGLLIAHTVGTVLVTATNEGISAVKRIDVTAATFTTTVTGIVTLPSGAPAPGAIVTTLPFGGTATTAADGSFTLPLTVPAGSTTIRIAATAAASGTPFTGTTGLLTILPGAVTDAGVLQLMQAFNGPLFPQPVFAAGSTPRSISLGDLDGDGRADLAVVNQGSNTVSVLLNNGNGKFAARVDYATGNNPFSVTLGDLDGDGRADLAVANANNNTVSVLRNLGNGTFDAKVDYATGTVPRSVALGDLDGDGLADLAVANGDSNTVSVLLNNGNGTFAARVDYATGNIPSSVVVGDLDGDGRADLAVANLSSNTVSVLRNLGNGTFAAKVDYTTGSAPWSVALGDMDGDGRAELAVANNSSNTVSVLRNLGNGTFAAKVDYTTGNGPRSVALGDLDSDGQADLAVAVAQFNTVSVLRNLGNGTFAARVDYTTGNNPYSVALGDLDGDGRADLAVANLSSNTVSVLVNNGDGTFAARVNHQSGGGTPTSVALGDLNADGRADLAVTNISSNNSTVSVLLNNGNGTLAFRVNYATGSTPRSVALGDLDGDGRADLAVVNQSNNTVSVLRNLGNGTFAARVDYATGSDPWSVALGDLDGDGRADLAVVNNSSNTVSVLRNLGNGTFAARVDYTTGNGPRSVALGDLDGDGLADLAVANGLSNNVSVLLNSGNGTFFARLDYATGNVSRSVALGDLDGDGMADLAVANGGSSTVSVLLNNGNGTFPARADYATGNVPSSVVVGDLDGDGRADLAVTNSSNNTNTVSVLLNNGNGTFAARVDYATENVPVSVALGDLDGNGRPDIAMAISSAPIVSVLLNQSGGPTPIPGSIPVPRQNRADFFDSQFAQQAPLDPTRGPSPSIINPFGGVIPQTQSDPLTLIPASGTNVFCRIVQPDGSTRASRAVRNPDGTLGPVVDLGTLGGANAFVMSVTPDGKAAVGWSDTAEGWRTPFIWTESLGMRLLKDLTDPRDLELMPNGSSEGVVIDESSRVTIRISKPGVECAPTAVVRVRLTPDRRSDIDADGVVSTRDLHAVLSQLGQDCLACDLNLDGRVDTGDLIEIVSRFGQAIPDAR